MSEKSKDTEIKDVRDVMDEQPKPRNKGWWWRIPFLLLLMVGTVLIIRHHSSKPDAGKAKTAKAYTEWQENEGMVFGTIYHIKYLCDNDLQKEYEAALDSVNNSLSMFNEHSTLRHINDNTDMHTDSMLCVVFSLAQKVSKATDGAFDVTVAPLVNAWGFGYKNNALPTEHEVDSLRSLVGYERVSIENGLMKKADPRMVMDFSAIAKGFGCDVVADVLRRHGVENFMVEIGGEVVVQGKNSKGEAWRVGVNKPVDDPTSTSTELEDVLELTNCAMATSGNYRNFYTTEDGRRIAHTIDPHTGYPVQHTILSATVLAPTCAEADAFATSFMVMGLEAAKEVLKKQTQLKVFLIYAVGEENKVYRTV